MMTRKIVISDPIQMPEVYSSTPGGTLYSTTPGGKFQTAEMGITKPYIIFKMVKNSKSDKKVRILICLFQYLNIYFICQAKFALKLALRISEKTRFLNF